MTVSKILTGTLVRGQSTITFTDSELRYSLIRIYCDQEMVYPIERNLSGTNQLQLIYDPQPIDLHIAVELIKEGIEIVDDLLSDDSNKVLSAKQGKVLKTLIDDIDPEAPQTVYSTEERLIGKWINDEDLYQKTVVFTGKSKATSSTVLITGENMLSEHGININNIKYKEFMIDYYPTGYAKMLLTTDLYLDASDRAIIWTSGGNVYYIAQWGSAAATMDIYLTLRYTKDSEVIE